MRKRHKKNPTSITNARIEICCIKDFNKCFNQKYFDNIFERREMILRYKNIFLRYPDKIPQDMDVGFS